ncbi:nucleoid-associated protein [Suicoccus acidiformans]|uniref:Nucleoid-associated protein CL176_00235 n=1 Tax=Suicoccus acidiformans TaxID=2036206 RepID=A0A347WHM1_9LACT|nr:nucleoid-associated protein [Suicoccus acidiformans]
MRGMGNMQGIMKQMQKMQKDMEATQKELENSTFVSEDTNQLVRVEVNGKRQLLDLTIQEALVDPDDIEMLEDLVLATVNEALAQVDEETQAKMSRFTQGMNLPF